MKKIAILHGTLDTGLRKKAVAALSEILLDYTFEYPYCIPAGEPRDLSAYTVIYVGTKENHPYLRAHSTSVLTHPEEYVITVKNGTVTIEGSDDAGVLYGCMDFYHKYITKCEYPDHEVEYWRNCFARDLPDFEYTSYPAVRNRGIWTWGHVIYDYRGFIDHMAKLKMNTLIVWNDRVPVNAADLISCAHDAGIKVIWGYAWGWENGCHTVDLTRLGEQSEEIFQCYERDYAPLGGDGIYFQSATEVSKDTIGGVSVAETVTNFVNETAARFYEKYPDLEIQFGLHATSVKNRLDVIAKVDPRIRIVWENCGAFPFAYIPKKLDTFDETVGFVRKIAALRGENDRFGAVTKGLTKLYWPEFEHMPESLNVGVSSDFMKANRSVRKRRIWRYLQAYWITNADKVAEMLRAMTEAKDGDLTLTALVEDGMFECDLMYPVALYAELLWDAKTDVKTVMSEVALRSYVTFA